MNICEDCDEIFKYDRNFKKLQEHHDRFHAQPKVNKNGTIQLNAPHQICLILKGNDSWEKYFKDTKRSDISWKQDGELLQKFEKDNDIEFTYCKTDEEIGFRDIEIPLREKIKRLFRI